MDKIQGGPAKMGHPVDCHIPPVVDTSLQHAGRVEPEQQNFHFTLKPISVTPVPAPTNFFTLAHHLSPLTKFLVRSSSMFQAAN